MGIKEINENLSFSNVFHKLFEKDRLDIYNSDKSLHLHGTPSKDLENSKKVVKKCKANRHSNILVTVVCYHKGSCFIEDAPNKETYNVEELAVHPLLMNILETVVCFQKLTRVCLHKLSIHNHPRSKEYLFKQENATKDENNRYDKQLHNLIAIRLIDMSRVNI